MPFPADWVSAARVGWTHSLYNNIATGKLHYCRQHQVTRAQATWRTPNPADSRVTHTLRQMREDAPSMGSFYKRVIKFFF